MKDVAARALPSWLLVGLTILVAILWALNFLARLVVAGYEPNASLDAMMTAILAAAFGASWFKRNDAK